MQEERKGVFDWSRRPKTPGNLVYIANPGDTAVFGEEIEKEHFIHMLRQYNERNEFEFRSKFIKHWFLVFAMILPWALLILRAVLSAYDVFAS